MITEYAKTLNKIYTQTQSEDEFVAVASEELGGVGEDILRVFWWAIDIAWIRGYNRHREVFEELNRGRTITIE